MYKLANKNKLKALVLAGGRGIRLSKYTEEINKCLLICGGRPLIEYSLDNAVLLGVSEIVVLVGYLAEQITSRYKNKYRGVPIRYAYQPEQRGLVHAMECSREPIGNSDFILFLGDEYFSSPVPKKMIDFFIDRKAAAVCGVVKVDDVEKIKKTYTIDFDKKSRKIFKLVEKPDEPMNNFMGTGYIVLKKDILSYIDETPINRRRGEKELPDLIQTAINKGNDVFYYLLRSRYVNVNTAKDLAVFQKSLKR